MTFSTLKRKTPLKSGGSTLRRVPFKRKWADGSAADGKERPQAARKAPSSAKRSRKVDNVKRLDMVFSLFVRLRDAMYGGRTRCISCGNIFPFESMQAGHFFSRRSMSTRWDERNVHSQCAVCNCSEHGNLAAYEVRLRQKIGDDAFEELSVMHNDDRRWSDAELKELIAYYIAEVRKLAKEKAVNVAV